MSAFSQSGHFGPGHRQTFVLYSSGWFSLSRQDSSLGRGGIEEQRLDDYVAGGLVDFDDVSYDDHADSRRRILKSPSPKSCSSRRIESVECCGIVNVYSIKPEK